MSSDKETVLSQEPEVMHKGCALSSLTHRDANRYDFAGSARGSRSVPGRELR